jgi:uncharacterized protein involved in exopolysaccharide biosynthesis
MDLLRRYTLKHPEVIEGTSQLQAIENELSEILLK